MIRLFASLLKQYIFWLLFFAVNRAVFLIYYHHLVSLENPGLSEVMASFWYALKLDISTASYILILPFFLLVIKSLFNWKLVDIANKAYTALIIIAYALITTTELGIYGEWKTKLHYKALHYLSHPDEVYNSASTGKFIGLIFIFIGLVLAGIFIYNRFFYRKTLKVKRNFIGALVFFILAPSFIFLGIRGGIQAIPITQSQSYYSNYNILNLAAVNSAYSFNFSMIENYRFMDENPYKFFEDDYAN